MPFSHHTDPDDPIRLTDVDAAGARLSAQKLHYVEDQFIKYLVPRAYAQPTRPPLINHGTYVRSAGIDELVFQWLELSIKSGKPCQIVSLGSGSDSRFWRLAVRL
jgi:[phosphatase 2A protein]-leucine-carboxy methyltransferase